MLAKTGEQRLRRAYDFMLDAQKSRSLFGDAAFIDVAPVDRNRLQTEGRRRGEGNKPAAVGQPSCSRGHSAVELVAQLTNQIFSLPPAEFIRTRVPASGRDLTARNDHYLPGKHAL